ncbi:hypothetical protein [Thiomonas sp. FB-Cd]|uniref:hypothetical protein n=1 Tax=Thiomonas sp. FB-Cd TaxID=1158292 RepID=UPI0012DF3299|nr:hypothetical protein [Thiomonas sp. FB-Cd]
MELKMTSGHRQGGAILLFALVALLIMFLGALFTLRGVLTDTGLTDRYSGRQKNIQTSDLALQWIANQIAALGNQQALEISAGAQPWYLNVQPAQTVVPTAAYWQTCMSNPTSTITCQAVPMPSNVPQSAWTFVEPTGRIDPTACGNTQGLTAIYYDVWTHTIDARGQVSADTESVYKLCVLGGSAP